MKIRAAVTFDFRYVPVVIITRLAEPTQLCCFQVLAFFLPAQLFAACQDKFFPFGFLEQVPAFYAFKLLLSGLRGRKTSNFPALGAVFVRCLPGRAEDGLCCFHLPISHLAGNLGPRNAAGSSVQEIFAHRGCRFFWVLVAWLHAWVFQPSHEKTNPLLRVCRCKKKAGNTNSPLKFSPRLPGLPWLPILHTLLQLPLADLLFWLFWGVDQRLKTKLFKK